MYSYTVESNSLAGVGNKCKVFIILKNIYIKFQLNTCCAKPIIICAKKRAEIHFYYRSDTFLLRPLSFSPTQCSFPYCTTQHRHRVTLVFFPAIHRLTGKPHKTFEAVLLCFPLAVSSLRLLLRFHPSLLTEHRSGKQTLSEPRLSPVLSLRKQGRKKMNPSEYVTAKSSKHDLPGSLVCIACPRAVHQLASFVGKRGVREPIIRFRMQHC